MIMNTIVKNMIEVAKTATTLLHELEDRELRFGLVSLCIGWGLGIATILERLP